MSALKTFSVGAFSQTDAARVGVNSRALYRFRDAGLIEQLSRGIYRLTDAPIADLDWLEIVMRRPNATLCLSSALAHYGLIDAIPVRTDVAILRGQSAPRTTAAVHWHSFDRASFHIGRESIPIAGTEEKIAIYSVERSLVDVFRLRGTEGYETGIAAVKEWLKRKDAQPAVLLELARRIPRALGPVKSALEYLA